MTNKLGLKEVIAMGVGGIVSGGIYAVLGVAIKQAGNAVVLSYLIAGLITLLTAYSYIKLTCYFKEGGGVFSFIEHTVKNNHVAGWFGWVLIAGYVGVMAMYAFAFGAFTLTAVRELFGLTLPTILRPVLSVGIIGLIAGINLHGVKISGFFEDVTVYAKIVILLALATLGIVFFDGSVSNLHFFNEGLLDPITAFAVIFVSYEGFQLLVYDYNAIENPEKNLRRGMYTAIAIAIVIYLSVSFMATLQLSSQQLIASKETALASAVAQIPFLGGAGFVLVIISAIKSTTSGINATLFGTSRLTHKIATEEELPRVFSFRSKSGIPTYSILLMAGVTAILTAFGSLEQITEFGSVAFLVADAAANYANLRLYKQTGSSKWVPFTALTATLTAIPVVLYHIFQRDPTTFVIIVGLLAFFVIVEIFHTERDHGGLFARP